MYLGPGEAALGRPQDDRQPDVVVRQLGACVREEGVVEADVAAVDGDGNVAVNATVVFV